MELGLTFTAPSQSATPLCFSNYAFLCQQRNRLPIKAVSSSSVTGKRTLSSNWDTKCSSSLPISAPRMPGFKELDTTRVLLSQRTLFLSSELDDIVADLIINQLLFLDADDPTKDIKIIINSPGGSITSAMGIYDAIKYCKADVSTVCFGIAASMGALILLSGTEGKRFCMPNARVMIHQLHGIGGGSPLDGQISVKEMNYHMLKVNKIISRSTGQPLEKVVKDTEYDYYMNAWEAKAYGIVDQVIDDGKPGLVAPITDASPAPIYGASNYLTPETRDGAPTDKILPLERRNLQEKAKEKDDKLVFRPGVDDPNTLLLFR